MSRAYRGLAALVQITLKLPGEAKKKMLEVLEEELAKLESRATRLSEGHEVGPKASMDKALFIGLSSWPCEGRL